MHQAEIWSHDRARRRPSLCNRNRGTDHDTAQQQPLTRHTSCSCRQQNYVGLGPIISLNLFRPTHLPCLITSKRTGASADFGSTVFLGPFFFLFESCIPLLSAELVFHLFRQMVEDWMMTLLFPSLGMHLGHIQLSVNVS